MSTKPNVNLFTIILAVLTSSLIFKSTFACTTAVISGKYTKDGRALLIKHRDSNFFQNRLVYFTDGIYNYIGLVNSGDTLGAEVWAGTNSAGFSIINSASYNLRDKGDTTEAEDREGIIMKLALMQCRTVEDFGNLLNTLEKPLGVEANFGVIDAEGGAAYFETNNYSYFKIDANDPAVAPFGYLIRTNYSFSRDVNDGYGYIRYLTAEELIYSAVASNDLNHEFLLQKVSRSLKHSLTGKDLAAEYSSLPSRTDKYEFFQDFIPRFTSTATALFHGVAPGESPDLTTMWTILGFQLCSVAIPVWVKGGERLPAMLTGGKDNNAPLCKMALILKDQCFPVKRGSGYKYINISKLLNGDDNGILQKLMPVEETIFDRAAGLMEKRRDGGIDKEEISGFYDWVDNFVGDAYKREFDISIE